jgi:hypothetical protein
VLAAITTVLLFGGSGHIRYLFYKPENALCHSLHFLKLQPMYNNVNWNPEGITLEVQVHDPILAHYFHMAIRFWAIVTNYFVKNALLIFILQF